MQLVIFFHPTTNEHGFLTTSTMASQQESSYVDHQFTFVLFHWEWVGTEIVGLQLPSPPPTHTHQVSSFAALVAKLSYLTTWTLNRATGRWEISERRLLPLIWFVLSISGSISEDKLFIEKVMSQEYGGSHF